MVEGRLSSGLEPFNGSWTHPHMLHLLRRCSFGVSKTQIDHFTGLSLEECVDTLLNSAVDPSIPVNDYNSADLTDPDVPFGETWVYETKRENADLVSARIVSLKGWWINNMLQETTSIQEKMLFFWHNHVVTQSWDIFWPHLTYQHFELLRKHSLGNFRDLIKEVTLDPQMLLYLNGALNNREVPDENYARELQELFCIGKGPDANFTESDVQEAARVLTGHSIDWEAGGTYLYRSYWHDEGDKQFSSFYKNTVISGKSGDAGKNEVDELLDMIFANNEVALFIVRKLYRFLVYSHIDEATEMNVIQPLAEMFRSNDYEIKPVVRTLLLSAHFHEESNRGAQIKNPLDFLLGFWRTFGVSMPEEATARNRYEIRSSMLWTMSNMGLEVMDPPNVAGYPAYYQFPSFDKNWITTDTVTNRALTTDSFIYWGFWSENLLTTVDLLKHLSERENVSDPYGLVDELVMLHLGHPVSEAVRERMVGILLTGQQNPGYWTGAWYEYVDNPADDMKRLTVEIRVKVLMQFLLQLSEYHLI